MKKTNFPLSEVYRLLEPGPVVLLTTARAGRANVMPMSWHLMMEFTPPLVGCVVSNQNYSFETLKATGECVINIPMVELAQTVVACGNTSGRRVDKFKAFGLTPEAAACVKAPLIAECYASLECKVRDAKLPPNTTSSFWKSSRLGLTRRGNSRGRYIIRAKASSWWRAGRSICLRQKLRSPENKCPPGKSGRANFQGAGGCFPLSLEERVGVRTVV